MLASEIDKKLIRETLDKNIKDNRFLRKRIIIFGCTLYARDIRNILLDQEFPVSAFIDNNPDKAGGECLGIPVFLPEDYLLPYDENIVVVICSKYYHEMKMQIRELGYKENNIINIPVQECFSSTGNSEEDFERSRRTVEEGYELYCSLANTCREESWTFICPYPGTGDIYMACSLLEYYLLRENITDYLVAVIGNNCVRVAKLFGMVNICNMTEEDMAKLLKAWEFLGTERMRVKPLLYWGWRTKRYLYADNYKQITFNEMFQYDVFEFPHLKEGKKIQNNKDSQYAVKLFEELGLKKGKTVILAPYAGSFVSEMKTQEWEKIAENLWELGYSVCTNSGGPSEPVIKGTTPIFFPYDEAINVLEYAGGIIALRSGLCDIISQAECRKVILYENGFNASKYDFFSLKKMGLTRQVTELIYSAEIVKEITELWVK